HRKESGICPPPPQIVSQVDAVQLFGQHRRGESAHPLVEIPHHQLRAGEVAIEDDRRQPLRLMTTLQDRGAEVYIVDMERVTVESDVGALQASRLARLPGEIVLDVMRDRKAAEQRVPELVSAKLARGRHHPAHAERSAE